MSNRRKPLNRKRASAGFRRPNELSRMARPKCEVCGSAVLWVDKKRVAAHGMDLDQAAWNLGVPSVDGLDMWICTGCDNGEVTGPVEYGSL